MLAGLLFKGFIGTIFLIVAFLMICSKAQIANGQSPAATPEMTILEPGKPIEREIKGGQKHNYQVLMKVGDYAAFTVSGREIGLKILVTNPQNTQITEEDTSLNKGQPLSIRFIAGVAGNYQLLITPVQQNSSSGNYEINLKELRVATETELSVSEARKLSAETQKLRSAGKYDEALVTAEKALAILTKIYGAESFENADIINAIGLIYDDKGDYRKAEQYYLRALGMYEKEFGAEHHFVATVVNSLGAVYLSMSLFDKAESSFQRALKINEKTFNPEHLKVADTLENLANLYHTKGEYSRAEPLYQRALSIYEKQMGPDDWGVGNLLNSLALIYRVKGDYPRVIQNIRRTLAIFEKKLPPEHPNIAVISTNLAAIYAEVGDFEMAEQLYQRALGIQEKALSPEHPTYDNTLNNIGGLYDTKGEYDKALPYFQRALAIREKVLGAEHPFVASNLNNVASIYRVKGEFEKAEPLYRRALEINIKKLGNEHNSVASTLNNLGLLSFDQGDYAKAEPLFQQASAIFEKSGGKTHQFIVRPTYNLALLYAAKEDFTKALAYQERYLDLRERNLELNLLTGSERQKLAYLETLSRDMMSAISLHTRSLPKSEEAKKMALELILRRKGRSLDSMSESISALRRRSSPEDRQIIDQLADVRTQLATLTLRGAGNNKPEVYQQRLKTLEENKEKLEDSLSRQSAEFRTQLQTVSIDSIRSEIPEDTALVEIVSFRAVNPKAKSSERSLSPPQYVAYVLRGQGEIKWTELGDAKIIDSAIGAFRQALRDPKRKDVQKLSHVIYEKVMSPIRALVGDAKHLLISPDGELNLIPFEALSDEKGKYLIENYAVSYLSSGRDLLRMQTTRESKSKPLAIGNPLFGEPNAEQTAQTETKVKLENRRSITTAREMNGVYFAPLAGSESEAKAIQTIFPDATLLSGAQATETAIKALTAPKFLHIATHGFFLEDTSGSSSSSGTKPENPLLRSGLALAGANQRKGTTDDGILTALEASGLNLWGTKLVVLSACDTGLGEIKNGEGVYGLRRSFVLAGTESMVMSLWAVSDYVTRELMTNYYKNLKTGMGRNAALRQVQLQMLKKSGRQHPFYWASFIQSGEWANLEGKR